MANKIALSMSRPFSKSQEKRDGRRGLHRQVHKTCQQTVRLWKNEHETIMQQTAGEAGRCASDLLTGRPLRIE